MPQKNARACVRSPSNEHALSSSVFSCPLSRSHAPSCGEKERRRTHEVEEKKRHTRAATEDTGKQKNIRHNRTREREEEEEFHSCTPTSASTYMPSNWNGTMCSCRFLLLLLLLAFYVAHSISISLIRKGHLLHRDKCRCDTG